MATKTSSKNAAAWAWLPVPPAPPRGIDRSVKLSLGLMLLGMAHQLVLVDDDSLKPALAFALCCLLFGAYDRWVVRARSAA